MTDDIPFPSRVVTGPTPVFNRGAMLFSLVALIVSFIGAELRSGEIDRQAVRPNILLIVADDLGYSDLGCYGGEIETPNLDRLAASGVRFSQFYTTARCCPSRASLMTGQYPHRVGLGHMTKDLGQAGYRGRVSENAVTIAQLLGGTGYRCFLSGKWHLGTDDPTQHGFEEFYGTLASAKTFWEADHFLRLPAGRQARSYAEGQFYGTDALTDHALDFLELARQSPSRPWFLYLAHNAPHFPLQAPRESIDRYAERYLQGWDVLREERLNRLKQAGLVAGATELTPRSPFYDWAATECGVNPAWASLTDEQRADLSRRMAIYAAMIDRMDAAIGRVFADLRSHGEMDNTLIVFTSDNGACAEWDPFGFDIRSGPQNILHQGRQLQEMGALGTFHSAGSGWANASNTPWRMYKHYCHEGGIAAPCIVHWPAFEIGAGTIERTPAHLIDVLPTCLEAAGNELPQQTQDPQLLSPAGVSLLPLLRGERLPGRTLFFEHEGHRAVRREHWKLVALRGGHWQLFDMSIDRTELNDLAAEHPEIVSRLSAAWDQWAAAEQVTPLPVDYLVPYVAPLK